MLGLTATTYFYAATRRFAQASALRGTGKRCSIELYLALRTLLESPAAGA
ncbi:MAG: hypothetical protein HY744_26555 [Deltaproteobacteria bacterium]|nr:hypothetical protein [Deltaproteobacteria bacterium]